SVYLPAILSLSLISFFSFVPFFFFNDPATPEIYTLSLHDALPIYLRQGASPGGDICFQQGEESPPGPPRTARRRARLRQPWQRRSEEHTSELQSLTNLVCRLLLEKKKNKQRQNVQDTCCMAADTHI